MNAIQTLAPSRAFDAGNVLLNSVGDLAICSNCCGVVALPDTARPTPRADIVLLDIPCPRCGQAAMRVSDGMWD